MRLLKTVEGLRCWLGKQSGSIGLVPTMGALHEGHLSLIRRARRDNDLVVVSIFVNPLQFGPNEDLDAYPRTLEADAVLCESVGVDCIFVPTASDLYGADFNDTNTLFAVVPPPALTYHLCGKFRPGHFDGVATVVTKLISLVRPQRSYFGQKDGQQLAIIRRLVQDLNLPGAVIGCPIVREADGLALSSRNKYLSGQERQQAVILYRGLRSAEETFKAGVRSQHYLARIVFQYLETAPAVTPQYVELVHPHSLAPLEKVETVGMLAVAAFVGTTRLIDNVVLRSRQPIIAIDGPAGAGKSTVARQLAHQLGLLYLDTGAMYRAFTWYVLAQGCDPKDEIAVADLLPKCDIKLVAVPNADGIPQPPDVWVNDTSVTQAIRTSEVTAQVSAIAAQGAVRQALVKQQMQYGLAGGVVADGRDIGTHVFPDAELKIFLTASVEERARRRQRDLANRNQPVPELTELAQVISERDYKDSTRKISPLRQADDAIEVITDSLTVDGVLGKLMMLYNENVITEE
ncbi:MAG: bifunctional pantoate--beta-alanine ligase/(d)CMP kinase [Leptolyngbyaceae cyanobacterium MAG.088]|nr:bifunctional pantoate--beta-alanine ligase/(d)CMP kinase [Leptolyngbyaceae cyanobacterium MAG.088]